MSAPQLQDGSIVTQGHCCHSNHEILQFWSDCNETMCVYMYVQLWFGILKMTTVSITMKVKNILFDQNKRIPIGFYSN
jgi:hypothetical protein